MTWHWQVRRSARAKLNLCLHVTSLDQNNYHSLDSLVAFTRLSDQLGFDKPSKELQEDKLEIQGVFAKGLLAEKKCDNLILRSIALARELLSEKGHQLPYFSIQLQKNIPLAGGMGGGSADAGACLNALKSFCIEQQWKVGAEEWQALALKLGADVPICLSERFSRMRGIGEQVEPLSSHAQPLPIVLVNPLQEVPTKKVFQALKNKSNPPLNPETVEQISQAIEIEHIASIIYNQTRNDLTDPAICVLPEIKTVLSSIKASSSCLLSRMSGSGGTCFGIYPNWESALAASQEIAQQHPHWWCCADKLYLNM